MSNPAALVIDDEPDICELLSLTLQQMNISTETAGDLKTGKAMLGSGRYDLCLTDMQLPDGNGLDLVEWMQTHAADTPVAVITAHGNVESAVRALKLGAFDFVSKPLDLADLRKLVSTAMRLRAADKTPGSGTALVGESEAMQHVNKLVAKVARSQAPVHICGESGTGKELVAHLIHDSGPRSTGPFVPVNCGAIPTELMESELFGHKKGSFTGAIADKPGLLVSAEGGTLFLDEVADLPLHMQVKLLRVIQEKTVRPVGETREISVDVRILSATHKHLADLVADGLFREDLYYRINVIELRVPPLRERDDDVILLANHILQKLARRLEIPAPALSDDAAAAFRSYSFPGNVRELENLLERALTMCSGDQINADDLQIREKKARGSTTAGGDGLGDQLESMERDAIIDALEQTRYNKTAAARLLGISFRALRYRIKKLGIE